eukprot:m.18707 g.18707  ORF g.18707 m.18707 type:complete len:415 (+) comp6386_c0_seq1:173-1417(+)
MPTPSTNRLHRTGYLVKQGGGPRYNWKKRWFVLDPDEKCLRYYETRENTEKAKGTIRLTDTTILDPITCFNEVQKDNCFGIRCTSPKRTYYMFDKKDGMEGCREWYRTITSVWRTCNSQKQSNDDTIIPNVVVTDQHASTRVDGGSAISRISGNDELVSTVPPDVHIRNHLKYYSELRTHGNRSTQNETDRLKTRVFRLLNEEKKKFASREAFERSVVGWQEDLDVMECLYCKGQFKLLFRRSHCRTCGKVVCASNADCSTVVDLVTLANLIDVENTKGIKVDEGPVARICKDCKFTYEQLGAQTKGKRSQQTKFNVLFSQIEDGKSEADRMITSYGNLYGEGAGDAGNIRGAQAMRAQLLQKLELIIQLGTMLVNLPECASGERQEIAANVRISLMTWYQPRKAMLSEIETKR